MTQTGPGILKFMFGGCKDPGFNGIQLKKANIKEV